MMEYRLKIDNMFEELTKVFKGEVLKDEPLKTILTLKSEVLQAFLQCLKTWKT